MPSFISDVDPCRPKSLLRSNVAFFVVMLTAAILLSVGLVMWYVYFGVECFINGGIGGWELPFRCWWDDLKNNLPVTGALHRLKYSGGDVDWALMMPGPIHFLLVNILLPLGPWLAFNAWHSIR